MKDLLEAGAHFGHKVSRWNPKMKPYIFGEKNGIYIIDLQKTVRMLEKAYTAVVEHTRQGKNILFVGTKRQAKDILKDEALRCGAFYVSERWLGGMLTNFRTIRKTIDKLIDYDKKKEEGFLDTLPKKEALSLTRKMEIMENVLGGVKKLRLPPNLLYVVDIKKEHIAVHEANILGIPVVAIVDTNTDPEFIKIPIPANDDAIRSLKLITSIISQAVIDGKQLALSDKELQEEETKKQVKKEPTTKAISKKTTKQTTTKQTTTKQTIAKQTIAKQTITKREITPKKQTPKKPISKPLPKKTTQRKTKPASQKTVKQEKVKKTSKVKHNPRKK